MFALSMCHVQYDATYSTRTLLPKFQLYSMLPELKLHYFI
jgi:hypothetical protein